jgi:hypothetical protein
MLLGLVLVITYGLQIGSLGFYWDDWEDVFLFHLGSPIEFLRYFIYDRPTTVWVYLIFFPLLGFDPVKWQVFNLVLRYLSLLGLWWFFVQLWPRRKFDIGWLVLFQQTISVTYSRHFMSLAFFSAALVLMVLALKHRRFFVPLTVLSAIASFTQMMTIEYFFGLEILRPFFLWVLMREEIPSRQKRFQSITLHWLPYLFPMAGFLYWRFVMFQVVPGGDDPNSIISLTQFLKDPVGMFTLLAQNIIQDIVYLMIFVWTATIDTGQIDLASKANWFGGILGALTAYIAWLVLRGRQENEGPEKENRDFLRDWLIIGVLALLAGGLPVWITSRQIIVGLWSDRFALGPMLGVTILIVLFVAVFAYRRPQKAVLLGVLLALSISAQIRVVNRYRLNWEVQRDYYWQFYWRVPAMKPGTALFGTKMPFGLIADYSVSYAINSIYAPQMTSEEIPYWFFSSMRAYGNDIPDFIPDLPVRYSIRNIKFIGNTSNGIVPHYKAGQACVRILRPEDQFSPLLTADEAKLTQISNLDQILPHIDDQRITPEKIFGPEPEHDWCYYYQKADLARQFGDWKEVTTLGDLAFHKGFSPAVGMEYQPFIEGYARSGDWQQAVTLTRAANELTNNMGKSLCGEWQRLENEANNSGEEAASLYEQMIAELSCQVELEPGDTP